MLSAAQRSKIKMSVRPSVSPPCLSDTLKVFKISKYTSHDTIEGCLVYRLNFAILNLGVYPE